MKMAEVTTYCSPGNGWANCLAQKYNCDVDLIEETRPMQTVATPTSLRQSSISLRP
jgi:hypothetical protein